MALATSRLPQPKWLLCAGVSVLAASVTWYPGAIQHLRYDRPAIASGEVWRLLSGHLVQLNSTHLFANLAGLFLLCELLWRTLPPRHGVGILLASTLGVSLMLWSLDPSIIWYVGLSGTLHGLWAGCALASILTLDGAPPASGPCSVGPGAANREALWLGVGALLLLGLKLALEYAGGEALSTGSTASRWIGAPIVTAAHRYGAFTGFMYILVWRASCWVRQAKPAMRA
jgi:rhomboid family GlyGly-CTERM serine protease